MSENTFERLRDAAPDAFVGTEVQFAYLFGSAARGEARPRSDVDVAIRLAGDAQAGSSMDLAVDLAGKISSVSGLPRVEVLVLNDAPLPVRGRAIRDGKVVFSRDEPARVAYVSLTLRKFFDHEIHARALDAALLRETAEGRR
jgi:hypothetical protein